MLAAACPLVGKGATTIVDGAGFEAPTFVPGGIGSQNGWFDLSVGPATATIQSQVTQSGGQALRVDRGSNSTGIWADLIESGPTGRYVSIDWDMLVETPPPTSIGAGPFFGVQVIDESDGVFREIAGFGIDAAEGELIFQDAGGVIDGAGPAVLGQWRRYRIELDYQEQVSRLYLGELLQVTVPFIDAHLGISSLTDADIVGRAANFDANSQANEGTAYFDNFLVRDGLRGDFNNDGVLNAADYTVWRVQNTSVGLGLAADGNADGVVNSADYWLWANNYGATNDIVLSSVSIPEPVSAVLIAVPLLAATGRRRR